LQQVANYVNFSSAYFSKLFKSETRENFSNYLMNFRINRARDLLKKQVYKASEVAEMTGFNNIKYFYKIFKKITGFTPTEYKNL